ncbi:MAG: metallophosphoesterase, partial [Neptuniibacter sp.]
KNTNQEMYSVAEDVIRLLQITDMHLQESPDIEMKGVNPEERFLQVMDSIEDQRADLLLLTGDLTHHAVAAYSRLSDKLQQLDFPSYWIPGNHDLVGEMYQFSRLGYGQKVIEQGNWRILLLDSTAEPDGIGGGSLAEPELEFLRAELEECSENMNLLLVLHHHPVSVNSAWQDKIMLGNAGQFWSIIDVFPQIRGVIFGHVHHSWRLCRGDVKLFSCPSTAAQFKSCTDLPEIEEDPDLSGPAFGHYELYPDGNIISKIRRLS